MVCTCLNFTVCDFVSKTWDGTKWNTERLLLVFLDSIPHHTFRKTCFKCQLMSCKRSLQKISQKHERFSAFQTQSWSVFNPKQRGINLFLCFSCTGGASSHPGPPMKGYYCKTLPHLRRPLLYFCLIVLLSHWSSELYSPQACKVLLSSVSSLGVASGRKVSFLIPLSVHLVFLILLLLLWPAFPEAYTGPTVNEWETH